VLWQKAAGLQDRTSLAAWLHRTTRNVCRNAQRSSQIRKTKEQNAMEAKQPDLNEQAQWNKIKLVLDDELDRLPEKYRLPLILFHLEGRQLEEIAKHLKSNRSTIETRLRRGREMLRQRIGRHGIGIETAGLMNLIGLHAGSTQLSASFCTTTTQAASLFATGQILPASLSPQSILLAKGTLQIMAKTKINIIAGVVAGILLLGGVSSVILFNRQKAVEPQTSVTKEHDKSEITEDHSNKSELNWLVLNKIISTLENQRAQVKSLSVETKSYTTHSIDPKVFRTWKRFQGFVADKNQREDVLYVNENVFAYKDDKYYRRNTNSTLKTTGNDQRLSAGRITYYHERATNAVSLWERRLNPVRDQIDLYVWPLEQASPWTTNPVYFSNLGWDWTSSQQSVDAAELEHLRKYDFLTLLKKGSYAVEQERAEVEGVTCLVLSRKFEAELAEYDPEKEENVIFRSPATETIWLDVDRGYAMLKRENHNARWGLTRSVNSNFIEILPGLWFPKKTKGTPFAPPEAPPQYQNHPVLSWNCELIRWSVNDIPESRFDIVSQPGDILYENGKKTVIDENNQPFAPQNEADSSDSAI